MNQYLQQILKEINTIIIPELGALTITNPSEGTVLFMPYLKYDDGKLAKYIAEKEGMPVADAKNMIARYVREITSNLDQGDSYDMFEFGSFSKNKDGDIIFTNWDGNSVAANEDKKASNDKTETEVQSEDEIPVEIPVEKEEAVIAAPIEETIVPESIVEETVVEEIQEEIIPEPIQEPEPEPIIEDNNVSVETSKEEEEEEVKLEVFPIDASEPIIEIPEEVTPKAEKAPIADSKVSSKKEQAQQPAKPKKVKAVKEKKVKEDNPKRKKGIIIILIALLLAVGGGFAYCYFQHLHSEKAVKTEHSNTNPDHEQETKAANRKEEGAQNTSSESEEQSADLEQQEEVQSEEIISTPEPIVTPTMSNSSAKSGSFYIILNAFTEEDNATNFISSLKIQGKNAINIGKVNQLHLIGIGEYASREEAFSHLEAEKASHPGAWVYQKK
jgi:flagellar basal body-associated protein FliL